MLTQSSIYKEYLDLMDTEAWKQYIKLKIYKLQQIVRPRIISDASTSEKLYNGEIKMYLYIYIYIRGDMGQYIKQKSLS